MSVKIERENFIAKWCAQAATGRQTVDHTARGPVMVHVAADDARTMLRYARTLQRLAEARCNGDYPADNGQRTIETCSGCESGWAPEVLKRCHDLAPIDVAKPRAWRQYKYCADCRTGAKLKALAHTYGYVAILGGDPRGYVVKLYPQGTKTEDAHSGRVTGWGVPA